MLRTPACLVLYQALYPLLLQTALGYLDVSVDDLVLMEVAQALQDLPGVEDDGGLLQGPPLGAQQSRQAPWGPETQRFIEGS